MSYKVSIIVLNWNGYKDTIECLESLRKVTYSNYEVILVDNASTDGYGEILRKKFPDIPFIQTGENLGFAGGNNIGIQHAIKNGADYVLLLNNDTVVDPEFVTELVKVAKSDKSIGILSSKIYFYDKPDTIWFAGAIFSLKTGRTKHIGYNKKDYGQYDTITEIDRACGCSMMITSRLCETVGLMKGEYFCYAEETDLVLRAKKVGFKITYVPNSKVWHKVSSSTNGVTTATYLYYSVRNTMMCLRANCAYKYRSQNIIRDVIVVIVYLASLFTMDIPKSTGIRMIYQGTRDYCRGIVGRMPE